ncbi:MULTISPECIES: DUF397 domain-containing protein [unclassified Streptomyces]|uniref:DUF397 domain-containing protein n=1 Tax=unclassified Streptomyces TaxID=2593676 RepID=UPI00278C40C0|nr:MULTISPECIES: DUF397 domain-containing protein [unclassified Streptomyces]
MNTPELAWFKSSYSGNEGGECLEVATHAHTIHIRDSKNDPATGPTLTVRPEAWVAFAGFAAQA